MSDPIRSTDHGFACDFLQSQRRSAPYHSLLTSLPPAAAPSTGATSSQHPSARALTPWLPSATPFDVVHIATLNTNNAQVLGRGGQGIVRRIHTPQGTMVLKEDLVTVDPNYYVQEMAIAAELLGCPNVVQYRAVVVNRADIHSDVMVPCGWLMEDLGDVTLHKWVRDLSKQPSTMTDANGPVALGRIMSDVATGLQALHHRGLVHMDVKPANIMVTSHGTAKLIDLGLVEQAATTRSRAGTHGFRAPEVASDETVMPTPATDMWSFGATLRWCLTALDSTATSLPWTRLRALADDLQQDVAVVRPTPDVVISVLKPKDDGGQQFDIEAQMRHAVVCLQAARQFILIPSPDDEEVVAKLIDFCMDNRTLPVPVLCKVLLTTAQRLLRSEDGRAWHCARELSSVLLSLARSDTDDVLREQGIDFDASLFWLDVRIQSGMTALIQEARRDALAMMQQVTDHDRRLQLRTRVLQTTIAGLQELPGDWNAGSDEVAASPATTVAYYVAFASVLHRNDLGGRENLLRAASLYDEALRIEHAAVGDCHPTYATALSNKANALQKLGDRENLLKAVALYDDVLRIERATLGDNHPSVASTLGNKANALQKLGGRENLLNAGSLSEEVLRITRAKLGDNHPSIAFALTAKANALGELGGRDNVLTAVALYDDVLRIMRATLGDNHPSVASALGNKANALQRLGDPENVLKAASLYDDALRITRTTLGDNHPFVASALGNKANALGELGDRENLLKAVALYDGALRIMRATLGDSHPSVASTLGNKANALQKLGGRENLLKALALSNDALRITRVTLGDNHPSVAPTLCTRANALRSLGDRHSVLTALATYDEELRIERATLGDNHPSVAITLFNKASTLHSQFLPAPVDTIVALLDKAIRIFSVTLGIQHPQFTIATKLRALYP